MPPLKGPHLSAAVTTRRPVRIIRDERSASRHNRYLRRISWSLSPALGNSRPPAGPRARAVKASTLPATARIRQECAPGLVRTGISPLQSEELIECVTPKYSLSRWLRVHQLGI